MDDNVKEKALDILRLFADNVRHAGCGACKSAYNEALALLKEVESAPNPAGFESLAFELGFDRKTVYVKPDARGGEYGGFKAEACGDGGVKAVKTGYGSNWSCVFPTLSDFRGWAEDAT